MSSHRALLWIVFEYQPWFLSLYYHQHLGPFLNCEVQEKLPISGTTAPHRSASRISLGALAIICWNRPMWHQWHHHSPHGWRFFFPQGLAAHRCMWRVSESTRIQLAMYLETETEKISRLYIYIYHNYVHILHVYACSSGYHIQISNIYVYQSINPSCSKDGQKNIWDLRYLPTTSGTRKFQFVHLHGSLTPTNWPTSIQSKHLGLDALPAARLRCLFLHLTWAQFLGKILIPEPHECSLLAMRISCLNQNNYRSSA